MKKQNKLKENKKSEKQSLERKTFLIMVIQTIIMLLALLLETIKAWRE